MKKLVAVVGMSGTGKSVATDYLESKGWTKIYFGGLIYDKMKEAGIEITPESQAKFRWQLRQKYGMAAVAVLLLPKIREAFARGDTVLDGLYSWEEYCVLRDEFGDHLKMICIVTDKHIRYERIAIRKERPFTHDEIVNRDLSEISLQKGGPIAYADYFIFNNGTLEAYYNRLEEILMDLEQRGTK